MRAPRWITRIPVAPEVARWTVHGQATAIEQGYFRFRSPYEGVNSLTGGSQVKNTVSATAFVGVRLWNGGAAYFNPEADQGFGLTDTHGVAAFPNGEAQKASFPLPRFVPDRLFLEQTFGLGGDANASPMVRINWPRRATSARDAGRRTARRHGLLRQQSFRERPAHELPQLEYLRRGRLRLDDGPTQLDLGALAELNQKTWAVRAGYFLLPTVSSTNSFDMHIPERGEYVAEGEWRYALGEQPGALRAFGWGTTGRWDPTPPRSHFLRHCPGILISR